MVRKALKTLAFLLAVGWATLGVEAWGQTAKSTAVSNVYTESASCLKALGQVPYYVPLYLGDAKKNPANGKDKILAPIESDACVHMVTMRGWRWAPIQAGTVFRWNVKPNGEKSIYAHDKCGNDSDNILYPPPLHVPETPTAAQVAPVSPQPTALQRRVDTLVVIHKQEAPFALRASVDPIQMIMGQQSGQGLNDYVVRGRGHKKLYAAGTAILLIGTAAVVSNHNNWWRGPKKPKGGLAGIETDSVVVTTPKCVATSYPNNCPGGNRLPGITILRFP